MADKPLKVKKYTVEEAGHKMDIIVPQSNDPSYDNYVAEAEIAKTKEELRHKPAPQAVNPAKREELARAIREYKEFKGQGRKYF